MVVRRIRQCFRRPPSLVATPTAAESEAAASPAAVMAGVPLQLKLVRPSGEVLHTLCVGDQVSCMEVLLAARRQLGLGVCGELLFGCTKFSEQPATMTLRKLGLEEGTEVTILADQGYSQAIQCMQDFEGDERFSKVATTLHALYAGKLHPGHAVFEKTWTLARAPVPSPDEQLHAMRRALQQRPQGVDGFFVAEEVRSFVKLMHHFTLFSEAWLILDLQFLLVLGPGMRFFKDAIMHWHVEMARLFASAQLIDDEPWWHRARSPIVRYHVSDSHGHVIGCAVMRPAQCMDIAQTLLEALEGIDPNLLTDWNSKDSTELSTKVLRVDRTLPGLTATGAISALGILHRVTAGVPTFVVADGGGAVSLEDVVDCLARLLRMRAVPVPWSTASKLALMADGTPPKLVNFQCELVDAMNVLPMLKEICGKCHPQIPSSTFFIFTTACAASDISWLNDTFPSMVVCWRN